MDRTSRRAAAALAVLALALAAGACIRREPQPQPTPQPSVTPSPPATTTTPSAEATRPGPFPRVRLVKVWSGLQAPLDLKPVPGAGDSVAIVEQGGTVRLTQGGHLASAQPFLDISGRISSGGERGLLGIAFPPSYPTSGRFYVYYTAPNGDVTISRFVARPGSDRADPNSEKKVLTVPHRQFANHNGGGLLFGPDGFLWAGIGDGGSGGDPNGNGQNRGVLLAKLVRLDVEGTGTAVPTTYEIPRDNPYAGMHGGPRREIWAYGLRNPWRFSFDRKTRDLYIADVGQNAWEEIDFAPAGDKGGRNYGWNLFEGTHPYPPGTDRTPSSAFTMPVLEYGHDVGGSITGGYVYRGSRFPRMDGIYFYGDFVSGRMWGMRREGGTWVSREVTGLGQLGISSFGEDAAGELYVCDLNGGTVYRLTAE